MSKIKKIEVSERELEDIIFKNPETIEDGLSILNRQIPTGSGPLDLLAVDSDSVLTVIELKNEINDGQLDQGLRYYDWVRSSIEWISRAHSNKVDVKQEPRLILIAPDFSDTLKIIAKYINIPLDLMRYVAFQLQDGDKGVHIEPVEIGAPPEAPTIPTEEENLQHIENESVRKLCKEALGQLIEKGVEVRPINNYWFSLWYRGKRFMYLGCKKTFFVCEIQKIDGSWSGRERISMKSDWENLFSNNIILILEELSKKEK